MTKKDFNLKSKSMMVTDTAHGFFLCVQLGSSQAFCYIFKDQINVKKVKLHTA